MTRHSSILKSQFDTYKTLGGYLCPNPVPPSTIRGCDNQILFSSEYMILLAYNHSLQPGDIPMFMRLIEKSTDNQGNLYRAPDDIAKGEIDLSPDDYHGVYAAQVVLGKLGLIQPIALPWKLWRFPQLILLRAASKGCIPWPLRLLSPLVAIIIALSCRKVPTGDTDSRLLSWLAIQGLSRHSKLISLASKVWYNRLYLDYPEGMKNVAAIYFQPQGINQNPYSRYWVTKP